MTSAGHRAVGCDGLGTVRHGDVAHLDPPDRHIADRPRCEQSEPVLESEHRRWARHDHGDHGSGAAPRAPRSCSWSPAMTRPVVHIEDVQVGGDGGRHEPWLNSAGAAANGTSRRTPRSTASRTPAVGLPSPPSSPDAPRKAWVMTSPGRRAASRSSTDRRGGGKAPQVQHDRPPGGGGFEERREAGVGGVAGPDLQADAARS